MITKDDFKRLAQNVIYEVFPDEKDSFNLSSDVLIDDLYAGKNILMKDDERTAEFQFLGEAKTVLEFVIVLYSMYETIKKILQTKGHENEKQDSLDYIGRQWKQQLIDAGISQKKAEKIIDKFLDQLIQKIEASNPNE